MEILIESKISRPGNSRSCSMEYQRTLVASHQACAANTKKGVTEQMKQDLDAVFDFYGEAKSSANVQATANITASDSEVTLISFSSYSDVADLFASWYIQEYILPVYEEEHPVEEFDPYDESKVDLTGLVNAK